MEDIIVLQNINKYYTTGRNRFHALRDVSLSFRRGEMAAVMGKSGCGKTTLLNIIGTTDSFEGGTYHNNGVDIGKLSDNKKSALRANEIGFVNQEFLLMNQKTALQNVMLPMYFGKTPIREMKRRSLDALEALGVGEQAYKKIVDMSGGQKQRIAIARALAIQPSLILADEPTGALDRATADEIIKCMRRLNEENGITVIIVTHDTDVAKACDRIIELSDGALVKN